MLRFVQHQGASSLREAPGLVPAGHKPSLPHQCLRTFLGRVQGLGFRVYVQGVGCYTTLLVSAAFILPVFSSSIRKWEHLMSSGLAGD